MPDIAPAAPYVAQGFGCTPLTFEVPDPTCPSGHKHLGIDLVDGTPGGGLYYGSPVYATRPGVVYRIGWETVLESHDLGAHAVCLALDAGGWLWYGHLKAANVVDGQRVTAGDVIGWGGGLPNTDQGVSTGPHLHPEYRTAFPTPESTSEALRGAQDPAPYLSYQPAPPVKDDEMPAEVVGYHAPKVTHADCPLTLMSGLNTSMVRAWCDVRANKVAAVATLVLVKHSGDPISSDVEHDAASVSSEWTIPLNQLGDLILQDVTAEMAVTLKLGQL